MKVLDLSPQQRELVVELGLLKLGFPLERRGMEVLESVMSRGVVVRLEDEAVADLKALERAGLIEMAYHEWMDRRPHYYKHAMHVDLTRRGEQLFRRRLVKAIAGVGVDWDNL